MNDTTTLRRIAAELADRQLAYITPALAERDSAIAAGDPARARRVFDEAMQRAAPMVAAEGARLLEKARIAGELVLDAEGRLVQVPAATARP